jgi:hypothetical protein
VPDPVPFACVLEVSATTGAAVAELLEAIVARLPEGPPLYPEDYLTDRPLRWLAAEQIRELCFELLHEELPYAIAVEVEEWKETGGRPDPGQPAVRRLEGDRGGRGGNAGSKSDRAPRLEISSAGPPSLG